MIEGVLYGSVFNRASEPPFYNAMIGEYTHGTNYTGDINTSAKVSNESIRFSDGASGQLVTEGWFWELEVGGIVYTKSKFGGIEQPCESRKGGVFQRPSLALRSLQTLYPVPGVPGDPYSPSVCRGYQSGALTDRGGLLTIEYRYFGSADALMYFSLLTDTYYAMSEVTRVREPIGADAALFANPCSHIRSADSPHAYGDRYALLRKTRR